MSRNAGQFSQSTKYVSLRGVVLVYVCLLVYNPVIIIKFLFRKITECCQLLGDKSDEVFTLTDAISLDLNLDP